MEAVDTKAKDIKYYIKSARKTKVCSPLKNLAICTSPAYHSFSLAPFYFSALGLSLASTPLLAVPSHLSLHYHIILHLSLA
jgi:hypothetical protein